MSNRSGGGMSGGGFRGPSGGGAPRSHASSVGTAVGNGGRSSSFRVGQGSGQIQRAPISSRGSVGNSNRPNGGSFVANHRGNSSNRPSNNGVANNGPSINRGGRGTGVGNSFAGRHSVRIGSANGSRVGGVLASSRGDSFASRHGQRLGGDRNGNRLGGSSAHTGWNNFGRNGWSNFGRNRFGWGNFGRGFGFNRFGYSRYGYNGFGWGRGPWGYGYGRRFGYGWPWLGYGFGWRGGLVSSLLYGIGGYGLGGYGYGYGGNGYGGYGVCNNWGYGNWGYGNGYAYDPYGYGYGAYDSSAVAPTIYAGATQLSTGVNLAAAQTPSLTTESTVATPADAGSFADKGEQAFKAGDYPVAVYSWQHAVVDDGQNPVLTMMLAQALFATGKFDAAAGATQAAMQQLPKDQWGVVAGNYKELYGNTQDYTTQLRALEKSVKEKPDDPATRFLLGFHYAYLGYPHNSVEQLDKVLKVAPADEMAKQLREEMKGKLPTAAVPAS